MACDASVRRFLGLACFGLVAIIGWQEAHAGGRWSRETSIPDGGANELIAAAVGEQVLVFGGQNSNNLPMGLFYRFDPASAQWAKLPPCPVPVHHGAVVGIGSKMYLFGGFRAPDSGKPGWLPTSNAWEFDTQTGQWTALPPMPTARGALAAVAIGTKVYVLGGTRTVVGANMPDGLHAGEPSETLTTNEVFDTGSRTWEAKSPMLTPRNHHSVAYVDGVIYAIGGRVGSAFSSGWSTNVTMNEAYSIAEDKWLARAPTPTAQSGTGVAVLDGKVHLLGGEGWIDGLAGVARIHEVYDPKANAWEFAPPMPTPRHGFAVAVVGQTIYAVSGLNNAGGSGIVAVSDANEEFHE